MSSKSSFQFTITAPLAALVLLLASCGTGNDPDAVLGSPDDPSAASTIEAADAAAEPPADAPANATKAATGRSLSEVDAESPVVDRDSPFNDFLNDPSYIALSEQTTDDFLELAADPMVNLNIGGFEGQLVAPGVAADNPTGEPGWIGTVGNRSIIRLFVDEETNTISKLVLAVPQADPLDALATVKTVLGLSEGTLHPFAGAALYQSDDDQFGEHAISGGNESIWFCLTGEDLSEFGLGLALALTVVDASEGPVCHDGDFFASNFGAGAASLIGADNWTDGPDKADREDDFESEMLGDRAMTEGYAMNSATIADFQATWDQQWHPAGDMELVRLPSSMELLPGTNAYGTILYDGAATLWMSTDEATDNVLQVVAEYPLGETAKLLEYFANVVAAAQGNIDSEPSRAAMRRVLLSDDGNLRSWGNENIWICAFRSDVEGSDKEPTLMMVVVDAEYGGDCLSDDYAAAITE